ncbi:hypothetical protein EI94DRAFT_1703399 [Lactarius quietus]|nr:hypothetical protein EI94DRAFT_1703399 [Lactarius quietus]
MLNSGEADYHAILPFLIMAAIWAQKGQSRSLSSLLHTFFASRSRGSLPRKASVDWGFELLHSILLRILLLELRPYFRQIVIKLLTRMRLKTTNYVYYFVYFLLLLNPDYFNQTVDKFKSGYSNHFIGCGLNSRQNLSCRKVALNDLIRSHARHACTKKSPMRKHGKTRQPPSGSHSGGQLAVLFAETNAFRVLHDDAPAPARR